MKNKLFLISLVFFTGCSPISISGNIQQTQTMEAALVFAKTQLASKVDSTILPALVPVINNSEYCNSEKALETVNKIKEIYSNPSANTPVPENGSNNDGGLTEAQRNIFIAVVDDEINKLEQLDSPDCLSNTILHLRNSLVGMKDLFTVKEGRTNDEIIQIMMTSGKEQQLFEEEFKKVQDCIPQGCN